MRSKKRAFALKYAEKFIRVLYEWGGDNPLGLDCSGFVGLVLRAVGLLRNGEDLTSQEMLDKFARYGVEKPVPGCLVFYGRSNREIEHVAIMVDDFHILEAGGGDSKTISPEKADEKNAFVRARPYDYRKPVAFVDPFLFFPS